MAESLEASAHRISKASGTKYNTFKQSSDPQCASRIFARSHGEPSKHCKVRRKIEMLAR